MEKKEIKQPPVEETKADLKHDTMEFAATAEGEDKLDFDDDTYEEEEISPEELDMLEEDDVESQAYALNAVETDRAADEDNLPDENWEEDLPGNNEGADTVQKNHHRRVKPKND
ncbi:MAG: hypothetical protein QM791_04800 [Ferruginibacter sp.]